jgi:hypothetical protein
MPFSQPAKFPTCGPLPAGSEDPSPIGMAKQGPTVYRVGLVLKAPTVTEVPDLSASPGLPV